MTSIAARKGGFGKALYELLSSMRFAISLLTVLAIASIIGTVLKQNEPYNNYIVQLGAFWFDAFNLLGLYDVYHSLWFMIILIFLVASTSTCILRNTPGMLREMRIFKEHASESSLKSFAHRAEFDTAMDQPTAQKNIAMYLQAYGFKSRVQQNESGATLVAAKAGSSHRFGYILTHAAIVIICIGGLIDGNVPLKLLTLTSKKIETRDVAQSQIPPESRLSPDNLSFRANVNIPEGGNVDVAFQNLADGYFVQELPFTIFLKKFHIDFYSTGQPKLFASDIEVVDKVSGEKTAATIEVNKPLIVNGIAIYQANFGDGGTGMKLRAWNLANPALQPVDYIGKINDAKSLSVGKDEYRAEFTDFRPFNVENLGTGATEKSEASALKAFGSKLTGLSSLPGKKDLHNVGPNFQFRLRDAQGQAHEFTNYMLPVQIDGRAFFISGTRAATSEPFRYLRMPADENSEIDSYMQFRAALLDKGVREQAVGKFVQTTMQQARLSEELREKLHTSSALILDLFASKGYDGIASHIEKTVAEPEREKAAQTIIRLLDGLTLEVWQLARAKAGKSAAMDEKASLFLRDAMNATSDSFFYGAPVYLQLVSYDEVKASGLQLTRSPGKNIVYFGSVLLVLGVFAMFYIRERRMWLLLKPRDNKVLFAMSSNRKTQDFEKEFEQHRARLSALLKQEATS
ncbi:MAG: cytochrome c biogenesis protein ResB [Burkholderiales bacterium]